MHIRPACVETDLPAFSRLISPYETNPVTVDQARSWFLYNPPERISRRLVAVDEGDAVIGYSGIHHEASEPDHYFRVWIVVDPSWRGRGIGSALWEDSLRFLQEQNATRLVSKVAEQDLGGLVFAERRGFTVDRHLFNSILDLETFDETPYLPAITALEQQGLRFCSLADFPDTVENQRKLYDLNVANVLDTPGADGVRPWTFEGFQFYVINTPWFRPAGQLLAVDGKTWAGLAAVTVNLEIGCACNEHTGVLRAYRGRKIAQGLKVMAVRYARQQGARIIRTDNDSLNAPILAINQKMGYQPQPGKYQLVRWL